MKPPVAHERARVTPSQPTEPVAQVPDRPTRQQPSPQVSERTTMGPSPMPSWRAAEPVVGAPQWLQQVQGRSPSPLMTRRMVMPPMTYSSGPMYAPVFGAFARTSSPIPARSTSPVQARSISPVPGIAMVQYPVQMPGASPQMQSRPSVVVFPQRVTYAAVVRALASCRSDASGML